MTWQEVLFAVLIGAVVVWPFAEVIGFCRGVKWCEKQNEKYGVYAHNTQRS